MMKALVDRRARMVLIILLGVSLSFTSCGTIMHPERKGQTGGRIDPGVAVLDGVGLLLFIIPGLIAYGVDFSTGAIYLPGTSMRDEIPGAGESDAAGGDGGEMMVVQGPSGGPTRAELEDILEEKTGRRIELAGYPGEMVARMRPEGFPAAYREQVEAGVVPALR